MTLTLAPARRTLVDRIVAPRLATDIALIAGGAAFTGVLAQIAVPLWPVPITGQTLAVLLVGSAFGALRGALALTVYAVLGIVGVPWFSDAESGFHVIAGPTGGYIVGFIAAAALTGWLAQRQWDRRFIGAFVSMGVGTIITFAVGLPWLAWSLGLTLQQTLEFGLYPFIIGGIVKALIAAAALPLLWRVSRPRPKSS